MTPLTRAAQPNWKAQSSAVMRRGTLRQPAGARHVLRALLLYMAVLPVFLNFALPVFSTTQRLLAWLIFAAAGIPFFHAMASRTRSVPLMPLLAGQYIIFYALPVFFEDSVKTLDGWITPASAAIDTTLFAVLLSLIAVGVGYGFAGKLFRVRLRLLQFTPSTGRLFWYATITLAAAILIQAEGDLFGWDPGSLRRPVSVALSADLGIAILACLFYQGALGRWQTFSTAALVVTSVVLGFSGGMFQSAVQPLLIWAVCRWVIKGQAPLTALIFIAVAFFLLQPVKGVYRSIVWMSGRSFTTKEKIWIYADLLKSQWLVGDTKASGVVQESRASAKKRLSLLLSTAHYVDWTPFPLPYRNGATLGYLVYGWVPRAVWPEKPIAQEANKVLPADYNVQSITNQNTTMFGVGHLAETYVNFGLFGIFPTFFLLGMLYRIPQSLLGARRTTATVAIFAATAVLMVPIGSSISDAFGGFLQQIFVQGLLLRIFTSERKHRVATNGEYMPFGAGQVSTRPRQARSLTQGA